jgi:hypothetical protein
MLFEPIFSQDFALPFDFAQYYLFGDQNAFAIFQSFILCNPRFNMAAVFEAF